MVETQNTEHCWAVVRAKPAYFPLPDNITFRLRTQMPWVKRLRAILTNTTFPFPVLHHGKNCLTLGQTQHCFYQEYALKRQFSSLQIWNCCHHLLTLILFYILYFIHETQKEKVCKLSVQLSLIQWKWKGTRGNQVSKRMGKKHNKRSTRFYVCTIFCLWSHTIVFCEKETEI